MPAPSTSTSVSTSPTKTFHQDKQPIPPSANPRVRSLTVGSTDSETASVVDSFRQHQKRHSQVFDMSPSSSDNEDVRSTALLRVQRRRQSSRRMSNISLQDRPVFRPLDVLVCEDHPVSRMVMERLLEKLKCRTIMVENGAEAMRYAMGEVKFDIILMEFKLPQINGEDVARMIRTSNNPNSATPIVAVTGYLKDLSDPQHFDELMEKPATPSKLIDVLERLCFWKAPAPERPAFGERKESLGINLSQPSDISVLQHGRMSPSVERFMSSGRPRLPSQFLPLEDDAVSISSSNSRTNDWDPVSSIEPEPVSLPSHPVHIHHQDMTPGRLHSHVMERIPSPLSTHVSAGMIDNPAPTLQPLPEITPLPPSMTATPVFGTPSVELLKSPLSRSSSPLPGYRGHSAAETSLLQDGAQKQPVKEEKSTPTPLDFKNRGKRSSLEKKKEKQGKQCTEGRLGDEADADDEDSISGGKKPNKSRSIGEIIRGVKRSPSELKRTRSSEGKR